MELNLNKILLTDLYQLTMAQGYWQTCKQDVQACFHAYFRDYPFDGGYAIACGMNELVKLVENFTFSKEDLDYLAQLQAPAGGPMFKPEFLQFLANYTPTFDIDAVYEGTVVFPHEPVLRVVGSILDCQLLETALLNCVGFETLIATKAARVCSVAGAPVAEFGLRRAQGAAGGTWASRAAFVGGCASTSNVLAGQLYGIPVSGTHAHSWVMAFDDELEAFRAYAKAFPKNCVLLVDTYNVEQGIKNAITVGLEMRAAGEKLLGIRIDSGDLAWLAKKARAMLDAAGLDDCGIVLSNDLDEYSIQSIRNQGAQVMSWGVGTKLATAFDQPTLGMVYKLSATRATADEPWSDQLKVSETAIKLTVPGLLDIRRYVDEDGHLAGDMVFDINTGVNDEQIIVDPYNSLRRKSLAGKKFETLLHPLARGGRVVLDVEYTDSFAAQTRARAGLETLDETQKRLEKPHTYPVGLDKDLFERRAQLALKLKGYDK